MKRGLILSDLHLRPRINIQGKTIEGDCEAAIQSLKEFCTVIKPEFCIIAGDIFHQRTVNVEELKLFGDLMEVLTEHMNQRDVFVIQGNHDRGENAIPEVCFRTTDLTGSPQKIGNWEIIGRKYLDGDDYREFISELRERDGARPAGAPVPNRILVLHYPCKPFSSFSESALNPSELSGLANIVVVGDTHTSEKYVSSAFEGTLVSPGCLFPSNIDELARKGSTGCFLCVLNDDGTHVLEKLDLCRREYVDIRNMSYTEAVNVLTSTLATKPLKTVIKAPKNSDYSDFESDYVFIRVSDTDEEKTAPEIAETKYTMFEKIDMYVSESLDGDPDIADVSKLVRDLIVTDEPRPVITGFINTKIGELK